MNIKPGSDEIKRIAKEGRYKIAPVCCEIMSDFITPIEALRILRKASEHVFLLESAKANEMWGRYTFLGYDPRLLITCRDGVFKAGDTEVKTADPAEYIRGILEENRSVRIKGLPPFTGGLVGYFSFEYSGYSEPAARSTTKDDDSFMDVDLMLFDKVIAFDNICQKIILTVNVGLEDAGGNYDKAVSELKAMARLLREGEKAEDPGGHLTGKITPLFDKKAFCEMVEKGKSHIREGDIFQIVLSNRLSAPFEGSLLDTYRYLRTINPSPYMFYFSGTDLEVAGASPETLVRLDEEVLRTFPLAGTRKRGATEEEDLKLEEELLADEKELAEHNMLVDLGRNDLGRISEFGTVCVEKLRQIERFSHVMHIGSVVRGQIRKDKDALDAVSDIEGHGGAVESMESKLLFVEGNLQCRFLLCCSDML